MRIQFLLLCCLCPFLLIAAETPIPSKPVAWVTDTAGFMTSEAADTLNKRLESYEKSSGRQIVVYIGKTTGGVPIEDWAVRAFKAWQVGQKGKDNGVVLFIMVDDKRIRIETGYGLEGQLTDALTARIINDVIQPKIHSNDNDQAVTSGVDAIVQTLDGRQLPDLSSGTSPPTTPVKRALTFWQLLFYGIVIVLLIIMFVTHPSFTVYLLLNILSGGRGGSSGGSSSGGGFSGGGGRSGGGGASGSW